MLRPMGLARRLRSSQWLTILLALVVLEPMIHYHRLLVPKPAQEQDKVFYEGCQDPARYTEREKAVLVMLAKNEEVKGALKTLEVVERRFNRFFNYPIMFLNDKPWEPDVMQALNASVSGGALFEVIPDDQWGFPKGIDVAAAKQSIKEQGEANVVYGGIESYHHMCRFFSGEFFLLDALKEYKWYWRIEPDVDFYCDLTYDPFVEMARNNKKYGWTIATWEIPNTVPSLFRLTSDYKDAKGYASTGLWNALITASWLPVPLRWLLSILPQRDANGDKWTGCHYWSNFEIASLDFFRSNAYQKYYRFLDSRGGFYHERWGDAPVHTLAAGMLLQPSEVHHFQDIGYMHDAIWVCPDNAPGTQTTSPGASSTVQPDLERPGGVGCRCSCPDGGGKKQSNHPENCSLKMKEPNTQQRPWIPRIL